MKKAFVTYLGTADFLPGVLALAKSLKKHNETALIILVTRDIPSDMVSSLTGQGHTIKIVEEIPSPFSSKNDIRGFRFMYTKLNIFGMTEFDKIVYLDADMLVLESIENLFEKPHLSAVVAGGLAPENKDWRQLNAGLLVVEPNGDLFAEMKSKVATLSSSDHSDQGFLHSFYENWPSEQHLHLEHKYNLPAQYIDVYCRKFDFQFSYKDGTLVTKNFAVLHYWGPDKPWHFNSKALAEMWPGRFQQSVKLWWSYSGDRSRDENGK